MDTDHRVQEALARQCLAETLGATGLHAHSGSDRRELVLNELVQRALRSYEQFRKLEAGVRGRFAESAVAFDPIAHASLQRTARLHLEIGRSLVDQLDEAVRDHLTVRNAVAFRQEHAALVAREALDHGFLPPGLFDLATRAQSQFEAGKTQEIDADLEARGARSMRTWDLLKRTTALDAEVQALAGQLYRTYFALDDQHPALAGRPLVGARRTDVAQGLWSVEITFEHRAFAVLPPSTNEPLYVWFWIGNPEDALRCTV